MIDTRNQFDEFGDKYTFSKPSLMNRLQVQSHQKCRASLCYWRARLLREKEPEGFEAGGVGRADYVPNILSLTGEKTILTRDEAGEEPGGT